MRRLVLVSILASTAALAQSRAPLGLRTQGPLRELFLDLTGADARSLAAPELDVRYTVANTWNEPMTLTSGPHTASQEMDEQADTITIRLRTPWSRVFGPDFHRVSTALEMRGTLHWGGYTDPAIEAWHSLSGAFNFRRGFYGEDELHLRFRDDGGQAFYLSGHGVFAFGDLVLRNQVTLFESASFGVAARLDLKFPTGSLSLAGGSGGFDVGSALLGTIEPLGWLTLHGLVGMSAFSELACTCSLQPKTWHFTAEISAAASWGKTTFLIEDRVLSPLFPGGWTRYPDNGDDGLLSSGMFADFRTHNQVSFAVRRGRFTVWASEDITPGSNPNSTLKWLWSSNAPDFVVGLSFTQPL
ncbi:MAG TPA: DUF3187 family protein [Myxococcales bacterium]|nr:DUF3187 family protein [Myxococcales bacterium]